ncbi:hypothetical protein HZA55_05035 [Candidatus Poribacteria bacterium]|nr:hypothetical protein [Candidatus Poribacteria bacterium]
MISYGNIEIASGTTVDVSYGTLNSSGFIDNFGTILNDGSKVGTIYCSDFNNYGVIDVRGWLEIIPTSTKYFDSGATWKNKGNVLSSSGLYLSNGAVINNAKEGVFNVIKSSGITNESNGAIPTFNNAGIYKKTADDNLMIMYKINFNNSGTMEIQKGSIRFQDCNGTYSGPIIMGPGIVLDYYKYYGSSTYTLNQGTSIGGIGNI